MDLVNFLKKSSLFQFMDENYLQSIVDDATSIIECKKGEQLFIEGQLAKSFFIVISGKVRISRFSKDGKEFLLKHMLKGDSFAEVVIFEKENYPATATMEEDSCLLEVKVIPFLSLLNEKDISVAFIKNLLLKIRFLAKKIELLSNADVPDRFFHFLESNYPQKEIIEIKESKKEIAQIIGTIPETFSRMIGRLKEQKVIISWSKNKLILKKDYWSKD